MAMLAPRVVPVQVEPDSVRLLSRLIQEGGIETQMQSDSWLTHAIAKLARERSEQENAEDASINILNIHFRINSESKASFSIDYVSGIGVPEKGFA